MDGSNVSVGRYIPPRAAAPRRTLLRRVAPRSVNAGGVETVEWRRAACGCRPRRRRGRRLPLHCHFWERKLRLRRASSVAGRRWLAVACCLTGVVLIAYFTIIEKLFNKEEEDLRSFKSTLIFRALQLFPRRHCPHSYKRTPDTAVSRYLLPAAGSRRVQEPCSLVLVSAHEGLCCLFK